MSEIDATIGIDGIRVDIAEVSLRNIIKALMDGDSEDRMQFLNGLALAFVKEFPKDGYFNGVPRYNLEMNRVVANDWDEDAIEFFITLSGKLEALPETEKAL